MVNRKEKVVLGHLGNAIFSSSARVAEGRTQAQAAGLFIPLIIYNMPKGYDVEKTLAFLSMYAAFGKSDSESQRAWSNWTFSYLVTCFPEWIKLIESSASREVEFKPFPVEFVDALINLSYAAEDIEEGATDQYVQMVKSIPVPKYIPELELSVDNFHPDHALCKSEHIINGFGSLLIFLCGKRITSNNAVTITKKRPMNLINALRIREEDAYILLGEGRMGGMAHAMVHQAWTNHSPVRSAIIKEVAKFGNSAASPAQRQYAIVTRLLEYSGMQPAYFINNFLEVVEDATEYPSLKPAIKAYLTSLREVAAAPRQEQPYYKLIHGEGTRAFHRASILPLSACAIAYEKYKSQSMANFELGEGAAAAVAMFDQEARARGGMTLQDLSVVVPEPEEAT